MSRPALACLLAISLVPCGCDVRPADGQRPELASRAAQSAAPRDAPPPAVTDTAQVGQLRLELLDSAAGCAVRFGGRGTPGTLALVPKPPCHFARRAGRPQVYAYPDVAVQSVLIVIGSAPTADARKRWGVPAAAVCGQETQGVLLGDRAVTVSPTVHRGGMTCRDGGEDEKEFWAFAHDGRGTRPDR